MQSSQQLKRCLLAFIVCTLVTFITVFFPIVAVPTTLASSRQGGFITDSTPSLVGSPSQLNEKVCHTNNHQNWTCIVTLYGENLAGIIVIWTVYTPISSISFSPGKGNLVELVPDVTITISHIPCMNTSFLFSGQVYGGGGVIPTTIPWSCKQKPTPAPTIQASPTPKIKAPTSTPAATSIPEPTPTLVISSSSQSDPPKQGNENSSTNIFMVSALIFLILETFVALILIAVLIKRRIVRNL